MWVGSPACCDVGHARNQLTCSKVKLPDHMHIGGALGTLPDLISAIYDGIQTPNHIDDAYFKDCAILAP